MSNALLAAALSAVTDNKIVAYDEYVNRDYDDGVKYAPLDRHSLHQSNLVGSKEPSQRLLIQPPRQLTPPQPLQRWSSQPLQWPPRQSLLQPPQQLTPPLLQPPQRLAPPPQPLRRQRSMPRPLQSTQRLAPPPQPPQQLTPPPQPLQWPPRRSLLQPPQQLTSPLQPLRRQRSMSPQPQPRQRSTQPPRPPQPPQRLFVITLSGNVITLNVMLSMKITQIKSSIQDEEGIPPVQQRLVFNGRQLEDEHSLSDYNIQTGSTLYLILKLTNGLVALYLQPDLLDPKYDYDFTNTSDGGVTFMRGNVEYKRPCGWKRIALNVLDKYGDNTWLGVSNRSNSIGSVQGEWPVSYHGTAEHNCYSIAEHGYIKGNRTLFGPGIYSTPDINVAARYATKFTHEGSEYIVVFQNRVNPNTLFKIPKEMTGAGEYWISPHGGDIRPYGICIKEVNFA